MSRKNESLGFRVGIRGLSNLKGSLHGVLGGLGSLTGSLKGCLGDLGLISLVGKFIGALIWDLRGFWGLGSKTQGPVRVLSVIYNGLLGLLNRSGDVVRVRLEVISV